MIYTKENNLVFAWEDEQEAIIPSEHIKMTADEVEAHLNPPKPHVTMEQVKQKLQGFCDGVAVAMVGDYKNSTEVLVYATLGDAEAQKFAAWYNAVWDLKASMETPPQDVEAWINNLPKFIP